MSLPALQQLGVVAAMWTVAVVTPGPNFLAATRIAASRDRRAGLAAVGGIGVGTTLWGLAGAGGVQVMFVLAPWLYGALKLVGAAYLAYLGARMIAGSFGKDDAASGGVAAGSAFRIGLLTSMSNPKSALSVGSLFAAIMPQGAPLAVTISAIIEMVTISLFWYALRRLRPHHPPGGGGVRTGASLGRPFRRGRVRGVRRAPDAGADMSGSSLGPRARRPARRGHPTPSPQFPDGTRTAADAAAAIGCTWRRSPSRSSSAPANAPSS